MTEPSYSLGNFEEIILISISELAKIDNAYGVTIGQAVRQATGRDVSCGALYSTLDRLEKKGYIRSRVGEPTPERGGRAKKFFYLDASGERALRAADAARKWLKNELWEGLPT